MYKVKYMTIALILMTILYMLLSQSVVVYARNEIDSCARGMVVVDGMTDTVLYSNNADTRLPMASTTKIATAIVAIENCDDLDTDFVVSDRAVGIEGTSIYLQEDEEISMRELLLGLMLASGNDCAVAIAEYFGYDNFIGMMNELCNRLDLANTHFDNPHGLDSDTHYTSAYDLAMITDYALDNETFREIASTKRTIIEATNKSDVRYLKHKNKLLFNMDGCVGVKTGFTDNAGRCLVNAHEANGMRIISVVLNCGPMFDECRRLTNMALDEYEIVQFVSPYTYVADVNVVGGEKNKISIVTIKEFSATLLKSEREMYRVVYDIPEVVEAPVELNSVLGKVYVYCGDEEIFSEDLYAIDSTRSIDIRHILDEILQKW
ncbi:MAG: D-alanyl-D-alanine carboxypeptidase [Clostridiales bacterium]|nr:D-alanyl-D-alanine carboxypeptidase [Clostridiales bacterium]